MGTKIIEFTLRHTSEIANEAADIPGSTAEIIAIDSLRHRASSAAEQTISTTSTDDTKFQTIFECIVRDHPGYRDKLQAAFDDYMIGYIGKILPEKNKFIILRHELLTAVGEQPPDIESLPDIAAPDYPVELDDPTYSGNVTPLR